MLDLIIRYVLGAVLLVATGEGALLYLNKSKIDGLEAQNKGLSAQLAQSQANEKALQTANDTQDAANKMLAAGLNKCAKQEQAVEAALTLAKMQAAEAEKARAAAQAKLKTAEEKIYASNQKCDAWGNALVCGALSSELQEQLRQASGEVGSDSGSSPPPIRSDTSGHDGPPGGASHPPESPR